MNELVLVVGLVMTTALIVCKIENNTLQKTINMHHDRMKTARERNIILNLEIAKLQLENYGLRNLKPNLKRRLRYLFTGKLT